MPNPYQDLPQSAFWRTAVAQKHFAEIGPLWLPKSELRPQHEVATFGSCFAQHIGRALQARGFDWMSTEPPPHGMSEAQARRFNYNVFTCRTGNIYTTNLLLQWTRWALGEDAVPAEVWSEGGRHFDPFRPTVEPDGFASTEEVVSLRAATLKAFADAITTADYFIFTLGLTESWRNRQHGYEYPMCPGTAAGTFDAAQHQFHNLQIGDVIRNLLAAIDLMRGVNRKLRFILTVSPVPLIATRSGQHVLVATMAAKSTLRAAAAHVERGRPFVDYFPSYELINSPAFAGVFFEANRREVSTMGVDFVMDHFFSCLSQQFGAPVERRATERPSNGASAADIACDEELLGAFGETAQPRS